MQEQLSQLETNFKVEAEDVSIARRIKQLQEYQNIILDILHQIGVAKKEIQNDITALSLQKGKLERDIAALTDSHFTIQKDHDSVIDQKKGKLDAHERDIVSATERRAVLDKECAGLTTEKQALERSIIENRGALSSLQRERLSLEPIVKELKENKEKLAEEASKIVTTIDDKKKHLSTLSGDISVLEARKKKL